jgi:uncharacterized protein
MRFVCDVMLGRLAKYLRILGFDAAYITSLKILDRFTRDNGPTYFLTRRTSAVPYEQTIRIKATNVREQLRELKALIRPHLDPGKMLQRCINCNMLLVDTDKKSIEHLVPEFVFHTYTSFKVCPSCSRVYWEGTHAEHMADLIKEVACS